MSDFAYHMEALRKARVLERKCQSQSRSGVRQPSGNDYYNPNDIDAYQPRYEMDHRDPNSSTGENPPTGLINTSTTNPPQTFRAIKYNMPIPELPVPPTRGAEAVTPMFTPNPTELNGTMPSPAPMKNVLPVDFEPNITMDQLIPDDNDDVALFDLSTPF